MKIQLVTVDLELSPRVKRWALRLAVPAAVLGAAAIAYAGTVPQFQDQQKLTAGALNGLVNAVNGLQDGTQKIVYTSGGRSYSINGGYCGQTPGTYDGASVGGYDGAKTKCESACNNSPTVHMCTADELVRSAALSVPVPTGWYASGVYALEATSIASDDCTGWTSNSHSDTGALWSGGPSARFCDPSYAQKILCCD